MKKAGCGRLYALGESLGGSVLIQAAAIGSNFSAIVAECPYADLREIAEYRTSKMAPGPLARIAMQYASLVNHLDLATVSPVRDIARARAPILLIHGLADSRTPPSNSERLAAANPNVALWLVTGADHTAASSVAPEEFRRRVLSWFREH